MSFQKIMVGQAEIGIPIAKGEMGKKKGITSLREAQNPTGKIAVCHKHGFFLFILVSVPKGHLAST
jgi:hypothetical protein